MSRPCPNCSRAAGPEDSFCGGCGSNLAAACLQCGRQGTPGATFCTHCGSRLGETLPSGPREDRRHVSVLFVDMVGFTGFAELADPEQVRSTQHEYFSMVRQVIRQYGGVVEKYIGDAVMAIFGAPIATENDALRGVRAGLELQRVLGRHKSSQTADLAFRVGVASGEALVDIAAAHDGGQAIVAGDVVNTAARLQAEAPPGGVLVDERTYDATRDEIDYSEQPSVVLRGRTSASQVWLAKAARMTRVGERDESTPMVDRDHERGLLTNALHRTIADRTPQLITVFGTAGIGKSRLLRELSRYATRLPGTPVRWRVGHCPPFGENVTYAALAEIVKTQVGILDTDDDTRAQTRLDEALRALTNTQEAARLAEALGPLLGLPGTRLSPAETESSWRRFLQLMAGTGPTVLVFEDMHWADEAMLRFVEMLCGAGQGLPLLVIATSRPELRERHPSWTSAVTGAMSISLGPMRDSDINTMYSQMFGQAVVPSTGLGPLVELAGGNPLYAHEYVRMLVERGELRPTGPSWTVDTDETAPMPQTVQAVIANRLDLLELTDRAVLQAAAVIGSQFWPSAIGMAVGISTESAARALHRLEQRDLVVEHPASVMADEPEYGFRHVLVRDVCYQRLPRAERVVRHQRAADWLERVSEGRSTDLAEVLANHRWAAHEIARTLGHDPTPHAPAARVALHRAARRAYSLHALDAAVTLVTRALSLRLEPDLVLELFAAELALYRDRDAFLTDGGAKRLAELVEALAGAGEEAGAARACTLLGTAAWSRADRILALQWLDEAARRYSRLPDSAEKAEALLELARVRMFDYETAEAMSAAQRAAEIADRLNLVEVRANARITAGLSTYLAGGEEGLAELTEVAEYCKVQQLTSWRRAAHNLAYARQEEGDLAGSNAIINEQRRTAAVGGTSLATSYVEEAQTAYMAGDWSTTITATAAAMRRPTVEWDLHTVTLAAWIRVLRGELDPAENDPVAEAILAARRSGFHRILRSTVAHAALCRVLQGRKDEARDLLDELDEDWSATRMIATGEWVAAAAHTGSLLDRRAARKVRDMLERSARRTLWVSAALATTEGALSNGLTSAECHLAAADGYRAIGNASDRALALWAAARSFSGITNGADRAGPILAELRGFVERNAAPRLLGG
ncbi:AAA family ATPase [Allocatelliglobosispora scoriae]|uniref:AAA family ATPase n=1 Tax=Allocatelliglobosispora scoriae TaxID=643052 RepID=UPI0035E426FD